MHLTTQTPVSPGYFGSDVPYRVPGGTHIGVCAWAATHSVENFKNADDFIPERWIDEEYAGDEKKASQPFSTGSRGCIGRQ